MKIANILCLTVSFQVLSITGQMTNLKLIIKQMIKQPTLSTAWMTEFGILSRAALTLQIFQAVRQDRQSTRF